MIEMRHRIRGRARWRIGTLYRNPPLGEKLEHALKDVAGIYLVRTRTVCASLVVRYDSGKLSVETLYGIIAPLAKGKPGTDEKIKAIEHVDRCRAVRSETERSRRAIRKMLQLAVRDAWVMVDGTEVQVAIEELRPGDLVIVHTGGKIPIDGTIETGEALLNEALITGKSEPAYKNAGDKVFAGSYVDTGKLTARARKVGGQTYLARIAALVEASLDQKAPLEQRADELAARLVRMGTGLTLLTLLVTRSVARAFTV